MKKVVSLILALIILLSIALCGCTKELKEDCKHSFTEEVLKEATCTDNGEKRLTCTVCKGAKTEVIEAVGHDEESKITRESTCTAKGEKTITCKNCGEETKEEIPLKEHNFEKESLKDATCTETGVDLLKCSVCGFEKESKSKALGHDYVNKDTKKATCTEDGIRVSTCSRCDESKTKTVAAYGHNWKNATCTSPKKCSNCGKTTGEKLGHKNDASGYCLRCGKKNTVDMTTRVPVDYPDSPGYWGNLSYAINSAGGVMVWWNARNMSGKTIKYCTLKIRFYNRVGDYAYDEIKGKSLATLKLTGPLEPGRYISVDEHVIAYVPTCSKIVIEEITLEYTDGTTETGPYNYASSIIHPLYT